MPDSSRRQHHAKNGLPSEHERLACALDRMHALLQDAADVQARTKVLVSDCHCKMLTLCGAMRRKGGAVRASTKQLPGAHDVNKNRILPRAIDQRTAWQPRAHANADAATVKSTSGPFGSVGDATRAPTAASKVTRSWLALHGEETSTPSVNPIVYTTSSGQQMTFQRPKEDDFQKAIRLIKEEVKRHREQEEVHQLTQTPGRRGSTPGATTPQQRTPRPNGAATTLFPRQLGIEQREPHRLQPTTSAIPPAMPAIYQRLAHDAQRRQSVQQGIASTKSLLRTVAHTAAATSGSTAIEQPPQEHRPHPSSTVTMEQPAQATHPPPVRQPQRDSTSRAQRSRDTDPATRASPEASRAGTSVRAATRAQEPAADQTTTPAVAHAAPTRSHAPRQLHYRSTVPSQQQQQHQRRAQPIWERLHRPPTSPQQFPLDIDAIVESELRQRQRHRHFTLD